MTDEEKEKNRIRNARYRIKHLEEIRHRARLMRAKPEFKEQRKKYDEKYVLSGGFANSQKSYREKNREKLRLYKAKWRQTKKGKESTTKSFYKQIEIHSDRVDARTKVLVAKREGILIKKPCINCGNKNTEAHHEDYTKPLEVIWLCRDCHTKLHLK